MAMDEKFWPSCKVCDYTFNFMAMSSLLQLVVPLHLNPIFHVLLLNLVAHDVSRPN